MNIEDHLTEEELADLKKAREFDTRQREKIMKYASPAKIKADRNRAKVWRHNSFHGFCAMSKMQMLSISKAETTTDKSRELASQVLGLLEELNASLKERRT